MEKRDFQKLSDEELLAEKRKVKKSKISHSLIFGFLVGIFSFGMISWFQSPDKKIGFLIPMLIPVYFIYKVVKRPNSNAELEEVLKERNLDLD